VALSGWIAGTIAQLSEQASANGQWADNCARRRTVHQAGHEFADTGVARWRTEIVLSTS
jgi:hypothetical protein